jgi:hypothetical protein
MKKLTLDQFNQVYLECLEESERVEHTEMIIARCYHASLGRILLIMDTKEGIVIIHHEYDSLGLGRSPALCGKIENCLQLIRKPRLL